MRVRVGRSRAWSVMAAVVGWIYFFIWSLSFWPQNVVNYRRRSVIGYNLDFAALNVTGFLFYLFYNAGLFWSVRVRQQYESRFPRSEIPIELNDVIYAAHAALATGITLVQCYVYEVGVASFGPFSPLSPPERRPINVFVGQTLRGQHVVGGARAARAVFDGRATMADIPLLLLLRQARGHVRQVHPAGPIKKLPLAPPPF